MTALDTDTERLFNTVHHLIKHGDLAAIRNLLDDGLSPDFANKFGWTILILAAGEGNTALGELLISRGADVNLATETDPTAHPLTAFGNAIISGRIRFAKLLLEHGAVPDPNLEGWLPRTILSRNQAQKILTMVRDSAQHRGP